MKMFRLITEMCTLSREKQIKCSIVSHSCKQLHFVSTVARSLLIFLPMNFALVEMIALLAIASLIQVLKEFHNTKPLDSRALLQMDVCSPFQHLWRQSPWPVWPGRCPTAAGLRPGEKAWCRSSELFKLTGCGLKIFCLSWSCEEPGHWGWSCCSWKKINILVCSRMTTVKAP